MKAFEVPTGLLKVLLLALEEVIPHFYSTINSIVCSGYFNFMNHLKASLDEKTEKFLVFIITCRKNLLS